MENSGEHPTQHPTHHVQHEQKYEANAEKGNFYDRHHLIFLLIPVIMLIGALAYIIVFYQATGDIMHKDVTLTGGTSLSIFSDNISTTALEAALKTDFPDVVIRSLNDVQTGKQIAVSIETASGPDLLRPAVEKVIGYQLNEQDSSMEFTGNSLSNSFYNELLKAMLLAFLFMSVVIFILFRSPLPSLYVILCAFADIVIPLAIVDYFGIRISTAGIAAFLMLIGYSVDTDILLTTVVLKRRDEETLNKRIHSAMKTGLTMTLTALATVLIAFSLSLAPTLKQIFLILAIGLVTDIIVTWGMNASLLKWYCDRKGFK